MGRGVKIGLASAVLLLGVVAAMFYRHPAPPAKTIRPTDARQPVLRPWTGPMQSRDPPVEVTHASPLRHPRAMIRASLETNEPPRLARAYPRSDNSSSAGWTDLPDDRLPLPANRRPALRIHKVAEGDDLALLAERYLGGADRAVEIFEMNRGVLSAPDAPLRIGVELRIPPRPAPAVPDEEPPPDCPLAPIHR
jgi:hypothetical protein